MSGRLSAEDILKIYQIFIDEIVDKKIEVSMTITPDNVEVHIEPWKPVEYSCPYGKAER